MFTLRFETENAAFDPENMTEEVTFLLKKVIRQIEIGHKKAVLHDTNGNRIGEWSLT